MDPSASPPGSPPWSPSADRKPRILRSTRAGLLVSVASVEKGLRAMPDVKRLAEDAPVFMAAVLEALLTKLVQLSAKRASFSNKEKIDREEVEDAIRRNTVMSELVQNNQISIRGAGESGSETADSDDDAAVGGYGSAAKRAGVKRRDPKKQPTTSASPSATPPATPKAKRKPRVLRSTRAGLMFPVARVEKGLRATPEVMRLTADAPITMTAALECFATTLIKLSAKEASALGKKLIDPEMIRDASRQDADMSKLLQKYDISIRNAEENSGDETAESDIDVVVDRYKTADESDETESDLEAIKLERPDPEE